MINNFNMLAYCFMFYFIACTFRHNDTVNAIKTEKEIQKIIDDVMKLLEFQNLIEMQTLYPEFLKTYLRLQIVYNNIKYGFVNDKNYISPLNQIKEFEDTVVQAIKEQKNRIKKYFAMPEENSEVKRECELNNSLNSEVKSECELNNSLKCSGMNNVYSELGIDMKNLELWIKPEVKSECELNNSLVKKYKTLKKELSENLKINTEKLKDCFLEMKKHKFIDIRNNILEEIDLRKSEVDKPKYTPKLTIQNAYNFKILIGNDELVCEEVCGPANELDEFYNNHHENILPRYITAYKYNTETDPLGFCIDYSEDK